ncbi:MAG: hypothetical protein N3D12_06560 [Candidatus Methanomethyliaceae archaeon]|nr:hypothetical protein [Candidatus Methanomethyliaceae archaeon]
MEILRGNYESYPPHQLLKDNCAIILNDQNIAELRSVLAALFGPAGQSLLYAIGKMYGIYSYKRMLNSSTQSSLKIIEQIFRLKQEEGWGNIEICLENDELKNVVIKNSFESRYYYRTGKLTQGEKTSSNNLSEDPITQPQCFFLKGFLEGILSFNLQKNIHLNEIECIAAGYEKCIFLPKC